jgi:uncharacterized protein with HEPN domain
MPSRGSDPDAYLLHIRDNIALARGFVEGLDYHQFCADIRTVYAVTRALEVISEASRRLPDALKERHPSIPWTDIAGAGNVYRHDYEDVRERSLWITVQKHLGPLLAVVEQELDGLGEVP